MDLYRQFVGTFGGLKVQAVEAVAVNAMNICMVLFFFQGIAVVGKFFDSVAHERLLAVFIYGLDRGAIVFICEPSRALRLSGWTFAAG